VVLPVLYRWFEPPIEPSEEQKRRELSNADI